MRFLLKLTKALTSVTKEKGFMAFLVTSTLESVTKKERIYGIESDKHSSMSSDD
jgi:hypothetical protein